jgi:hypothetical protein
VLMGGDRLGKVCVEAAVLQAAGFADREEPLDGAVAVIGLGSVARASPHDRVTQRSFRGVVRGRHILDPGERPERVVALQESCAEPGGLRIAATGALFQQLAEFRARGRKVGLQGGQVRWVTAGLVDDLERVGEAPLEVSAETARRSCALPQGDEVTQHVRETELAFGVVDVQVDGVAVRHDHPIGIVAEQRSGRVTVTPGRDLKQGSIDRRGDRQPAGIAGLAPRGLIRASHRGPVEMLKDPDVRILKRSGGLLDQRLDRRDAEPDSAQVLQQPARFAARHSRCGQRRRGSRDARPESALRHAGRQRRERAVPTLATRSHPPMLTHLDDNLDVADLMGDGVAVRHPVLLADQRAATITLRRPVRLHAIRVSDHRAVLAGMPGLTALRTPRPFLPRPRLTRIRRITRRRQRTVARVTTDLTLELINPCHQLIDPLGLRLNHSHDSIKPGRIQRLNLIPPHERKIPCTPKESCQPARRPPERLRGENTLGLFIAINGFASTAVEIHSGNRSPIMLMDGGDLYAVLDERIDLNDLLRRKRRETSMTGRVLLTAAEILGGR